MNSEYTTQTGSGFSQDDGLDEEQPFEPAPRLFRTIRRNARRSLTARWGKTAAGFLFLCGIVALCMLLRSLILEALGMGGKMISLNAGVLTISLPLAVVNLAAALVVMLLISPLGLGYLRMIYQMTAGEEPMLSVIFDPLRSVALTLRSIWAALLMMLMNIGALSVCCMPGVMAMFAARMLPGSTGNAAVCRIALLLLGMVLIVIGVLLAIMWTARFFAVGFLLADEDLGVIEAFKISLRISRGFTGEIFMLMLSFIPAAILCILLIPAVFVVPYMTASFGLMARVLIDRDRKMREDLSSSGPQSDEMAAANG